MTREEKWVGQFVRTTNNRSGWVETARLDKGMVLLTVTNQWGVIFYTDNEHATIVRERMILHANKIKAAAYGADLLDSGVIRWNYSGRYMYGETCFGIIGSVSDFAVWIVEMVNIYSSETVRELIEYHLCTDDMGKEKIFYFPGVQINHVTIA